MIWGHSNSFKLGRKRMKVEAKQKVLKKHFGGWFLTKRTEAEKSQRDIAKGMAYGTPQFVSNWERGVSLPPLKDAPQIAGLLKIPGKEILAQLELCELALVQAKFREARKRFL